MDASVQTVTEVNSSILGVPDRYQRRSLPRLLYIQYTNPAAYPPLGHSSRILADMGWQILFLGTEVRNASAFQFKRHQNIVIRQMPYCPAGWRQKLHYLRFCVWVVGWLLRWRPKWIYVSDPLVAPLAWLLSYLPRLQIIYHEHGTWSKSKETLLVQLCYACRRQVAQRALMCILPNEERAKEFEREINGVVRVVCVWNCPIRQEVVTPRAALSEGEVWLLYHGSIVPERLPLVVLDALALLDARVKLRIIGYETIGHIGYKNRLLQYAKSLSVDSRVELISALPRHELFEWCRKSDIGLALTPMQSSDFNFQTMTGASNKAFDYLANGLAVLGSNRLEWRDMFVVPKYGLSCDPDNAVSIATAIRWFVDHPMATRQMGEEGRQRIEAEWNYETQFAPVLTVLNR